MKLTKQNAAMIMGRINKFLQKDTKRDENGKQYEPFIGVCDIYRYRKPLLRKKNMNDRDKYIFNNILLEIRDIHSGYVVPLYTGYDIKITGNSLIIKENRIMGRKYNYDGTIFEEYKQKYKSTYVYFYHMPISEDDKKYIIRKAISNLCLKFITHRDCRLEILANNNDNVDALYDELKDLILQKIIHDTKNLNLDGDTISIQLNPKSNHSFDISKGIYLHIDINDIINADIDRFLSHNRFYLTYKNKRYRDLSKLVLYIALGIS